MFAVITLAVSGCSRSESHPPAASRPALFDSPVEFTVRQRTTTTVPESHDRLVITIDDVTRNQVMVSVATADEEVVLALQSMVPLDTATFHVNGQVLSLRLLRLNNSLVGEDDATFRLSADRVSLTETQKIEKLIQSIADLPGATFIRNGSEHSATEAADHLKSKWRSAGARVTTAQQFIDGIASRSSSSGKPYQIRLADGIAINAGDFLRSQLQTLERDH